MLLIMVLFLGVIGFAGWGLSRVFFTGNERFILRRTELNGLDAQLTGPLMKYLKLTFNRDNLFDIDLAATRRKIEQISYIKSASVYRVLPDTLRIDIMQRVPMAYLSVYNSKWVVDEDSIVMNRKYCMKLKYPLPVVSGVKYSRLRAGEKLPGLTPAIQLIKLTAGEFRNFKICSISLEDPQKIVFVMIRERHAYKVLMPRRNLKDMLQVLRHAFRQKRGDYKSTVDLTYSNQVIFR